MDAIVCLRDHLREAKHQGTPWCIAWPDALKAALHATTSSFERDMTEAALEATQGAWRRAYFDQPALPGEVAAVQLACELPAQAPEFEPVAA